MLFDVSVWMAFMQGVLSFLTPCVLPLVPVYLGYLAGTSLAQAKKSVLMLNACLFVLGFSAVFVAMGATATAVGAFLSQNAVIIQKIAGVALIAIGALMIFPPPFMQRERRMELGEGKSGAARSLLMGVVFAFGWSPCIGPVLASVLVMAASAAHVMEGIGLLLMYSLGMAVPFLLMAMLMSALQKPLAFLKKHMALLRRISAVLIILMGILILSDTFTLLAKF